MLATNLVLIALVAQAPTRVVDVAWPSDEPLTVACPLGQTTRLVFPEPLRRLKTLGPDRQALAVTVERTTPTTIVSVRAGRHPAQCGLEFHGTTLTLRLDLKTTDVGEGQELRFAAPKPPDLEPTTDATPPVAPSPSPTPRAPDSAKGALGTPALASAAASTGGLALEQLPWAKAVPIGRREGLPGQHVLVVEDALRTDEWIWYRLRIEGGASEQVTALEWNHGALSDYQQVSDGPDRRIVVRVPRRLVGRGTRLELRLASGETYRVSPFSPTVTGFFRRLFR
jgi:hypothetical protein